MYGLDQLPACGHCRRKITLTKNERERDTTTALFLLIDLFALFMAMHVTRSICGWLSLFLNTKSAVDRFAFEYIGREQRSAHNNLDDGFRSFLYVTRVVANNSTIHIKPHKVNRIHVKWEWADSQLTCSIRFGLVYVCMCECSVYPTVRVPIEFSASGSTDS